MFDFVALSCLFLAAFWSSVGKGLTSWLSCEFLVFVILFHKCLDPHQIRPKGEVGTIKHV